MLCYLWIRSAYILLTFWLRYILWDNGTDQSLEKVAPTSLQIPINCNLAVKKDMRPSYGLKIVKNYSV